MAAAVQRFDHITKVQVGNVIVAIQPKFEAALGSVDIHIWREIGRDKIEYMQPDTGGFVFKVVDNDGSIQLNPTIRLSSDMVMALSEAFKAFGSIAEAEQPEAATLDQSRREHISDLKHHGFGYANIIQELLNKIPDRIPLPPPEIITSRKEDPA
jgi:hypothetical protein